MAFFKLSKSPAEGYDEEIKKNKIILFLILNKVYQVEVLRIAKSVADKCDKILYVSLNKPAESIMESFKENGIDAKKFLFIDAVSKGVNPNVSDHGTIFITPPKNFEKFDSELSDVIEKEGVKCLIFDSLSTMLVYQDESSIVRFAHDLITKLMMANAYGEFICLAEDIESALVKDISMFVDKVVDSREKKLETETEEEWKKKEKIMKLEEELSSIRKAYALKLISEPAYLTSKKRIEEKLEKLRK